MPHETFCFVPRRSFDSSSVRTYLNLSRLSSVLPRFLKWIDSCFILREDIIMRTILTVLLVLLLLGIFPIWPYSVHWGYFPGVSLGTVLIIALIVVLLNKKRLV